MDAVLADVAASSQCLEEQPAQSRRPRSLSHPATAISGAAIVSPHRPSWRPVYRCFASVSCHSIHRRRAIQQTRSSERPLSTPPRLLSQRSRLFSSPVAPGDLPLHPKTKNALVPPFCDAPLGRAGSAEAHCRVRPGRARLRQRNSGFNLRHSCSLRHVMQCATLPPQPPDTHSLHVQCSRIQEAFGWQAREPRLVE